MRFVMVGRNNFNPIHFMPLQTPSGQHYKLFCAADTQIRMYKHHRALLLGSQHLDCTQILAAFSESQHKQNKIFRLIVFTTC